MKTSNKLLIASLTLLVSFLVIYDFALKAEYATGCYKDPLKDFVSLDFKGFNAIDINASGIANVQFIQGDFDVKINKHCQEYVRIKNKDGRMQIDVESDRGRFNRFSHVLIIKCPEISELTFNNFYTQKGKVVYPTRADHFFNPAESSIEGFEQQAITITQSNSSIVKLIKNKIGTLKAKIGNGKDSKDVLNIHEGNIIDSVELSIQNKGELSVKDSKFKDFNYKACPTAKISFEGGSLYVIANK